MNSAASIDSVIESRLHSPYHPQFAWRHLAGGAARDHRQTPVPKTTLSNKLVLFERAGPGAVRGNVTPPTPADIADSTLLATG